MPAESEELLIETERLEGAVPLVGLRISQFCEALAVQLRVPGPLLLMATFCAGATPPTVVLKARLVGETDKMGVADEPVTVSWKSAVLVKPAAEPETTTV